MVREIFSLRLTGMSYQRIARTLNEQEVPSPGRYLCLKGAAKCESYANSRWTIASVKKVLTAEVYLGHMVQGRKRSGFSEGKKPYYVPESEWVIVRDTHEPLVDEETFRAVQKMAVEASSAYKERLGCHDALGTIPNILRGLIFCADYGRPLVRYKCLYLLYPRSRRWVYSCPLCHRHHHRPPTRGPEPLQVRVLKVFSFLFPPTLFCTNNNRYWLF